MKQLMRRNGMIDINTFINLSKGKTESTLLKLIIEDCFEYDPTSLSQTQFLRIVYDLFRIIMPDQILETEKEFNDKRNISETS